MPAALRVLGAEAGDIEFQQHRVMHQAIDGRGGRHLIAEDPIPLARRSRLLVMKTERRS